jgi:glycosyltransferase involved in cell wall biosynthesis
MDPDASIVVIVKNCESTIAKCLDSLISQTVKCEIVVVDGNSTDRTCDIVKTYPVKLISAPKRDSYGTSRNIGVKNAKGKVILFMDGDDYAPPAYCQTLLRHFKVDSTIGIVTVPREANDREGWFLKMLKVQWSRDKKESIEVGASDWKKVTTKGSAFLKDAIEDAGWFDEDMFFGTEDKEIAYRIQQLGYKIQHDPSDKIYVEPIKSTWDFLKDKFSRSGMGHGYLRKKHGQYHPPFGWLFTTVMLLLALFIFPIQPLFTLIFILLSLVPLRSFLTEGVELYNHSKEFKLTTAFILVKWISRILEFVGFTVALLIPVKMLRDLNDAL